MLQIPDRLLGDPPKLLSLAHENLLNLFKARVEIYFSSVAQSVISFLGISPHELRSRSAGFPSRLRAYSTHKFRCDEVGKAFGVLRIKGFPIEIALPRTEKKAGIGHKGFDVEIDPNLPFEKQFSVEISL